MADYSEGQTATNPRTGQRVVFRGGQWVNDTTVTPAPASGGRGMFGGAAEQKRRAALQGKLNGAIGVERQLDTLQQYYDQDFKGVGPGSLLEYLPTQRRKRFDAAANGMRPLLKPLVRDPGEGAFTDADQALLDSLIPSGGASDADTEQRFKNIRAMIDDARRNAQQGGLDVPKPRSTRRDGFRIIQ